MSFDQTETENRPDQELKQVIVVAEEGVHRCVTLVWTSAIY